MPLFSPCCGAHCFSSCKRFVGLLAALVVLSWAWSFCAAETPAREVSTNSTFADGLKGWQTSGDVRIEASAAHPRQRSVRIGPGPGAISQQIKIGAENHMMLSAVFDGELPASCKLTVRFLDKDRNELMRIESGADMHQDKDGKMDNFFRPHPRTASIEVVVSKAGNSGSAAVDQLKMSVYDDDDPALNGKPQLFELMRPFWQGGKISQEAVALISANGEPPMGTLMFRPSRIVSVTNYDGSVAYKQEIDYRVAGRTLIGVPGSQISRIQDEKLLKGETAWNEIGGQQVLVTYEHEDAWTGPVQPYVGADLPNTAQKLEDHEPLEIVAYGDSITFGVGSSHMQRLRPYQIPWIDLLDRELVATYGDRTITLDNASQSGADSNWAKTMAGRMVASLHPDLVIIAFGQNDFWRVSPDSFAENIASVIHTVRQVQPKAEFLLISTMRFDPAYSAKPSYWNTVTQYEERLRALTGIGVQLVDMTAISGAVFAAKAPKDCLNDPLHPNDYLSRWYAQSMMAALVPDFAMQPELISAQGHALKKGIGDNDKATPEAINLSGAHWYYNWTAHPSHVSKEVEFIPMVWGNFDFDGDIDAAKRSGARELLTFNEPDGQGESNLTVDEAIALWPKLQASGLRLGSPATTTGSPWIDQFLSETKAKNLRVDFLCLHWYGDITKPNAIADLRQYLQGYWDRYHLPIWLTEFSGADFSYHLRKTRVKDNAEFAAAAVKMLEQLPFIERYAWYGTKWEPNNANYPTSGLYNDQTHALTAVGRAYREAGVESNVPKQ